MRNRRTILVEGTTDRKVVSRVIQELNADGTSDVLVDSAEIIKGPLGNREKVEAVFDKAMLAGCKIAACVDREYRRFKLTIPFEDELAGANFTREDVLVWTHGHSIENYFFQPSYFLSTLKTVFPEKVPPIQSVLFNKIVDSLIVWAASLSVAFYQEGILGKCRDLLTYECFSTHGENVSVNLSRVAELLCAREIHKDTVNAAIAACTSHYARFQENPRIARLLCDGHLGYNVIWAGVACLVLSAGGDEETSRGIERGMNEQKLRSFAEIWSREIARDPGFSPKALWDWEKKSRRES